MISGGLGHKEGAAEDAGSSNITEEKVLKGTKMIEEIEQSPWREAPEWVYEENLKYCQEPDGDDSTPGPRCCYYSCENAGNGSGSTSLMKCSRCACVQYCSRECQKKAWKPNHKRECQLLNAWKNKSWEKNQSHMILEELFKRIRMYMCPYAVGFSLIRGNGFVFLRSKNGLSDWIYGHNPVNTNGVPLSRSVQLQYMTLGEFDSYVFEDDFELGSIRDLLVPTLEKYDPETQIVVVLLLRCGYYACVTLPLGLDYKMCKSLAAMYKYVEMDGPLQLNVDEQ
mmetsp:Transcript_8795/g.14269  ORF Transcript_8795/g.14269 Transcript_8795/m.14269 type:complete len:282 (-) Transcript_8795:65-910(-)|eukprot:CAMPEP_0203768908 /NCGR_PEP_ID=MMETSP0099_2-20121227/1874_1 /ASSEMBLY_ACC=CAM_ASM_000209 /TAXON_ID=96639 /ORGANISM=" , Strain NY0313808BC1" /LENGTH=281 /DNA_ID=CAMNT_0050665701 /DNA_START=125 /DNA_END=970 /DNA_ORIENTATION=-